MGEDGVGEEGLTVHVPSMERVGLLACYLYRTGSLGEDGVGEEGLTVHLPRMERVWPTCLLSVPHWLSGRRWGR